MSEALHWCELDVLDHVIPADKVQRGRNVRFVMSHTLQYALLDKFFIDAMLFQDEKTTVWVEYEGKTVRAGESAFAAHIGSVIRGRGLMANLTLRENLLLPFLYDGDAPRLQKVEREMNEVAEFIGLHDVLDEQAGERSGSVHAMLSLGRYLLQKPDVVIVQEVHAGMSADELEMFTEKMQAAFKMLGSGVLYLTSLASEAGALQFDESYDIDGRSGEPCG